jgi:hypothetical protein
VSIQDCGSQHGNSNHGDPDNAEPDDPLAHVRACRFMVHEAGVRRAHAYALPDTHARTRAIIGASPMHRLQRRLRMQHRSSQHGDTEHALAVDGHAQAQICLGCTFHPPGLATSARDGEARVRMQHGHSEHGDTEHVLAVDGHAQVRLCVDCAFHSPGLAASARDRTARVRMQHRSSQHGDTEHALAVDGHTQVRLCVDCAFHPPGLAALVRAQPDAIADSRSYTEPNARADSRPHAIPNFKVRTPFQRTTRQYHDGP